VKRLIILSAMILWVPSIFAQTPEKISYQAIVRDANDNLVSSQSVGMQISFLQSSPTGTAVYVERHFPSTNINGLLTIEVGAGTIVSGSLSSIDWSNGPYFIKTETDLNGGANYTISGTSQLLSVPYALHSKTAETVSGGITETDPIFGASVANGITGTDTTYWNNKLDSYTETDPIFGASVASGITGTDTTYWNNKLDSYTETDPIFGASVASGITGTDTTYWNNKLDSYTETDPIFGASVASGITGTDTTYWNNKLDSYTETDPIFGASVASGITGKDTTYWNNKLDSTSLIWQNTSNNIYFNNGNVGIGTTSPLSKLHINDTLPSFNSSGMRLTIESGNQQDSYYRGIDTRINGTAGDVRAIQGVSDGNNSQYNFGVIGWGLNAKENRGATGISSSLNTNPSGFNYGVTGVASGSVFSNIAVGAYAESGDTTVGDNYGVSARSSAPSTGVNFGIYSTASNGGTNYAGYFNGNVTVTGTFSNPSDAKLKSNIQSLNNATSIIKRLTPVEYEYKHDIRGLNLPENHQYGFVAQELELVLPELVSIQKHNLSTTGSIGDETISTNENDATDVIEYKGINYISLIPIMVQSMKEQEERIAELEKMVLKMQDELNILKEK
jgi:hypothetical protein